MYIAKRYQAITADAMAAAGSEAGQNRDIIDLTVGDPDLATPGVILEKAFEDARAGHTKYTQTRGYPELRAEIMRYYGEVYGISLDDGEIMITTGGCVSMFLALEAILDPGDEVIIHAPYFTPYPSQVRLARGVPVFLPSYASEGFAADPGRLEALITPRTKALILNSPNNPTGAVFSRESLAEIAVICERHDIMVIADDIYTMLTYGGAVFHPIMEIGGMRERTITINSFSKNFIMTGFRIGNIVAPESIIRVIEHINNGLVYTAPSVSQRAALHALRNRESFCAGIVAEFERRMAYTVGRLSRLGGVAAGTPRGGIYVFPSIAGTGRSCYDVARILREDAGVKVLPGAVFGPGGEEHLRIALTVGLDALRTAFDRMEALELFHKQ